MSKLYMVFDIESVGLHGEGFAVGYVVVDERGNRLESDLFSCKPENARAGSKDDFEWVKANIPPIPITDSNPKGVRDSFWHAWEGWKKQGAILLADCAWPVEARFLIQCVEDSPEERNWGGPYPLHDLASVLLAKGKDPVGKFGRLPIEMPEHDPLNDASQSARILIETLNS